MAKRTVAELLNLPNGKFLHADDLLTRSEEEVFLVRRDLEELPNGRRRPLSVPFASKP